MAARSASSLALIAPAPTFTPSAESTFGRSKTTSGLNRIGASEPTNESYSFSHETRTASTPDTSSTASPRSRSGTTAASPSFAGVFSSGAVNTRASRPPPGGPRQPTTDAHSFSSGKYPTRTRRERTTAGADFSSPGADFSSRLNAASSEATVAASSRLAHASTTGLDGVAHESQRLAESRESFDTWPRASAALDANAAMFNGVAGSRNTPTGVSPRNSVICI